MQAERTLRILGSRVDPVDMETAVRRVAQFLAENRFAHVVTFGSEMAMLALRDHSYRDVVNAADLIVPDTIGIVCAARLLGHPLRERVAGIELVERVCGWCASEGIGVFLLGGAESVAEQAGAQLQRRYPGLRIAGTHHGYFTQADEAKVLACVRESGAKLVLVALGFPDQEYWIRKHAGMLGPVVCIGVGGTLDVLAGKLQRAPELMRRLGLEWFYRLVREPQRIGRQLVLPQFAVRVAGQAVRERLRNVVARI